MKTAPTPFRTDTGGGDDSRCNGKCSRCGARCCAPPPREKAPTKEIHPEIWEDDVAAALSCLQEALGHQRDNGDSSAVAAGPSAAPPSGTTFQKVAPKILMKILYAARLVRHDLLRCVCGLACRVITWDADCDASLQRLMCYIYGTTHYRLCNWVGNTIDELTLHAFGDADFVGDARTNRSTSGACFQIWGTFIRFITHAQSKRQSCVSHSTPEAELVAADFSLRTQVLPALILWAQLAENPPHWLFLPRG